MLARVQPMGRIRRDVILPTWEWLPRPGCGGGRRFENREKLLAKLYALLGLFN